MTKLFIANTTLQSHQFIFTVIGEAQRRFINIKPGEQIMIPKDLSPEEMIAIVHQHEPYGIKKANELPRNKKFVGLCWNEGGPVKLPQLETAIEQNQIALDTTAAERLEKVTAATANYAQKTAVEMGAPQLLRTEVQTETDKGGDRDISKGVEIPQPGTPSRRAKA
jgi:predicted metal-dependent hydrolase